MNDETQNNPSSVGTGSSGSAEASFPQFFLSIEPDYSGKTVGGYQIIRKIAEGGMGVVYEAMQTTLDRRVALKVLNSQIGSRPEFLRRFEREAKASAALNHPNIMQVYDFVAFEGRHCLIMEFIEGEDLAANVDRNGKFSIPEALGVVEQAAQALKFACSKSIIHRDIKPSNLMLTTDGRVKVSDLGLAKMLNQASDMTATGDGLGSPHFIAPEQADDARRVDHRVDIYALGITLLYLLTGKKPFDGGTPYSVVLAHVNKPLPSGAELGTDLPPEVEGLIRRMAAKNPDDRYPDYDALLADILRVRDGFAPTAPLRVASPKKSPLPWIMGAAAVVVIGGGAIWWGTHAKKAAPIPTPVAALAPAAPATTPTPEITPVIINPAEPDRQAPPEQGQFQRPGPPGMGQGQGQQFRPPTRPGDQGGQPMDGGSEGFQPGPGGPRGPGAGGPGGMKMPMGGPPKTSFIQIGDGAPAQMMAKADAFAAQHPTDYREIIDAYQQVMQKAGGSPVQAQVEQKFTDWQRKQQQVTADTIKTYQAKMQEKINQKDWQGAWNVWRDFPNNLRARESDTQIRTIIKNSLPSDFQPQ